MDPAPSAVSPPLTAQVTEAAPPPQSGGELLNGLTRSVDGVAASAVGVDRSRAGRNGECAIRGGARCRPATAGQQYEDRNSACRQQSPGPAQEQTGQRPTILASGRRERLLARQTREGKPALAVPSSLPFPCSICPAPFWPIFLLNPSRRTFAGLVCPLLRKRRSLRKTPKKLTPMSCNFRPVLHEKSCLPMFAQGQNPMNIALRKAKHESTVSRNYQRPHSQVVPVSGAPRRRSSNTPAENSPEQLGTLKSKQEPSWNTSILAAPA